MHADKGLHEKNRLPSISTGTPLVSAELAGAVTVSSVQSAWLGC